MIFMMMTMMILIIDANIVKIYLNAEFVTVKAPVLILTKNSIVFHVMGKLFAFIIIKNSIVIFAELTLNQVFVVTKISLFIALYAKVAHYALIWNLYNLAIFAIIYHSLNALIINATQSLNITDFAKIASLLNLKTSLIT
jgi:hypothetical protein